MRNSFRAILLSMGIVSMSQVAFAANGDALIKLDAQRSDILHQITNELAYGHLTLVEAQKLKNKLDPIVAMETKYKEGHQVQLKTIANTLQSIQDEVTATIHKEKVWMGIDSHNMALKQKINDAFDAKKLTKEEANNLTIEEQTLRNHETVSDTASGLEFDDAIAIAKDINQLDAKIDRLSND